LKDVTEKSVGMKKPVKSRTKTIADKKKSGSSGVVSRRKNTSADTRGADRQRSGGNDPQRGSH